MSTFAPTRHDTPTDTPPDTGGSADDFSILEQRVLRAVELLKSEREARAAADSNAATLQQLLDEQSAHLANAETRLRTLEGEREQVRSRVERMMKQLDEVAG